MIKCHFKAKKEIRLCLKEKAISENLSLTKIWESGNAIECSSRFSAAIQVKEEPGPFQANAVMRRDIG